MKVTRKDIPFLVRTVGDARKGRASITQMATAQHLATGLGCSGIAGELADHISERTKPVSPIFGWKLFGFGVAVGITANLIARRI